MGDMAMGRELPSYQRPPVIEVAVGVHFLQLPGLNTVALLRLVDQWRDRYPKVLEQVLLPPLPPMGATSGSGFLLEFGSHATPVRLWALNEDDSLLIQVQHDRLLVNWRKQSDGTYPRYSALRRELTAIWSEFERHIAADPKLGVLRPTAAEVTFLNRLHANTAAEVIEALSPTFYPDSHVATRLQIDRQLGNPDDGKPHGRQTISLSHPIDGQQSLQLEIASVVAIDGGPPTLDVMSALDFAHEEGVLMFDRFTTATAHTEWGKVDASN